MVPVDQLVARAGEHRECSGRPLVTLTYAQSLDGSITAHRGRPLAISGRETLALTHQLRAVHDSILVGIGTVLADDPRLTVRYVEGEDPQPIILDTHLRLPLDANILSYHRKPWVFTSQSTGAEKVNGLKAVGCQVFELPLDCDDRLDLGVLLDCLGNMGIDSLMVEGGARVITSFLAQGLADQVVVTIAPVLIGGLKAVESLGYCGETLPTGLEAFPRLKDMHSTKMGDDLVVWGQVTQDCM